MRKVYLLFKTHISSHTRHLANGKVVNVIEHEDKRKKRVEPETADAPPGKSSVGQQNVRQFLPGETVENKWGDIGVVVGPHASDPTKIVVKEGATKFDWRIDSIVQPKKSSVINVDGVKRPSLNSLGQPIHPTKKGVRNFWRWFGDSENVDGSGRPILFRNYGPKIEEIDPEVGRFGGIFVLEAGSDAEYHSSMDANYLYLRGNTATSGDISEYFNGIIYGNLDAKDEYAFLNSVIKRDLINEDNIEALANSVVQEGNLENIQEITGHIGGEDFAIMQKIRGAVARRMGFGSVHIEDEYAKDTILIVSSGDVKSATDNNGEFSPDSPDFTKSLPLAVSITRR